MDDSERLCCYLFVFDRLPSMMKMAVAPVSIIACDNFCRLLCPGAPKRARAVAAIVFRETDWLGLALVILCWDVTDVVVFDSKICLIIS